MVRAGNSRTATSNSRTATIMYGDYNDAKAYGLTLVLGSYRGVATIIFISVILDLLAKLYGFCREEPYIPAVYLFSSRSSYLTGDT